MSVQESKATLTQRRVKLLENLTPQISPEQRSRIQEEVRVINAQLKALNTTEAYRLKAEAEQRKAAGLAEAQANAARAAARARGSRPSSAPGEPGFGDPINRKPISDDTVTPGDDEDDDPRQTAAVDGWIDAVLLRHDVDFTRNALGRVGLISDPSRPHVPQKLAAAIELLIAGVFAAARGQELPDLPRAEMEAVKALKTAKTPKAKSKRSS